MRLRKEAKSQYTNIYPMQFSPRFNRNHFPRETFLYQDSPRVLVKKGRLALFCMVAGVLVFSFASLVAELSAGW